MGRHGYLDDEECEQLGHDRYRKQVAFAMYGERGQALLRELRDALDAMTDKRLIKNEFVRGGQACAMGVVALSRGIPDAEKIDRDDHDYLAKLFDVAPIMVREIQYKNDDCAWSIDPASAMVERWELMREWVGENIDELQDPLVPALREIAAMKGQTIFSSTRGFDGDRMYMEGASAAFERAASVAAEALLDRSN